jgi:cytochrome d ubiquinol oxidase subunit I
MDVLTLARLQFAVTTLYHYIFVPLTLGLSIMVAVMQTQYVRTNDEKYKRMAKFWGKLFLINFAMGVVTGIVQEFQFGMNWSEYSRFVGDIFGAPLAVEALMAFFIESTFLGVWIFGWDKLPKRIHLGSIWLVAIASNISAFWILTANSFMQNPVGYELVATSTGQVRAQMTDFGALLTNNYLWHQFPHVFVSGLLTAAFFVIGISAYRLVRVRDDKERNMFVSSIRYGFVFGLSAVIFTLLTGHAQAQYFANHQPMKLAAAEGLWDSEDPAGLSLFQIGDEAGRDAVFNIRFPWLLSVLAYNTPSGMVYGINDLNEQYIEQYSDVDGYINSINFEPYAEAGGDVEALSASLAETYEANYANADFVPEPLWMTYWSFRAMVGAGSLMALLAIYGLWRVYRGNLLQARRFLAFLPFMIVLPYLANSTGWMLTELGRQPWIVQGLMRTEQGLTPAATVTPTYLIISLLGFIVIYGVLMVADFYLLWKYGSTSTGEVVIDGIGDEELPSEDVSLEGAY